jgi:branched-chain amino acid aminotransferase
MPLTAANVFTYLCRKYCTMSECLGSYYISNGKLADCDDFYKVFQPHPTYIYEVFRVMGGIPLFLEDHLERLLQSANLTGYFFPWNPFDLEKQVTELINANGLKVGNIKFVFCPGTTGGEPLLLLYITEHQYPTQCQFDEGVGVVLFEGIRDNPNAKIMDVALRQQTNKVRISENVYEALLVDNEGYITEGSRSNVFFITGDVVFTPPTDEVLPGITRKHIIECCHEKGIPIREERVNISTLEEFDAAFISGTSRRVLPINQINTISFDPRHQLIRQIQHAFNNKVTVYLLHARMNRLKDV